MYNVSESKITDLYFENTCIAEGKILDLEVLFNAKACYEEVAGKGVVVRYYDSFVAFLHFVLTSFNNSPKNIRIRCLPLLYPQPRKHYGVFSKN